MRKMRDMEKIVVSHYRRPQGNFHTFIKTTFEICRFSLKRFRYIIICGDPNVNKDTISVSYKMELIHFSSSQVNEPTRVSIININNEIKCSTLDYIITNTLNNFRPFRTALIEITPKLTKKCEKEDFYNKNSKQQLYCSIQNSFLCRNN